MQGITEGVSITIFLEGNEVYNNMYAYAILIGQDVDKVGYTKVKTIITEEDGMYTVITATNDLGLKITKDTIVRSGYDDIVTNLEMLESGESVFYFYTEENELLVPVSDLIVQKK